jgi:hypothetical protein
LNEQIAVTEGTIKQLVLTQGASAAGSHLQAIFMGGRVSWDNKALSVYATMHPEIKQYRKEGEPYVVIKARGFRAPAF